MFGTVNKDYARCRIYKIINRTGEIAIRKIYRYNAKSYFTACLYMKRIVR